MRNYQRLFQRRLSRFHVFAGCCCLRSYCSSRRLLRPHSRDGSWLPVTVLSNRLRRTRTGL